MTPVPHPLAPEVRPVSVHDLAWLIGSLLLVIAPHWLRAPWWLTLLTLCLFAWRFSYALNGAPLPSRWLLIGVAVVSMLGVFMEYRTLFGRQPGILLLTLFAGLKLMETRSHRDAAAAVFLAYFLIITNFLYTQSMPAAALMCVALLAITTTLVGFNAPQRTARANVRTAGLLLTHAVPAALALFVLFPRVHGPLWGLPQDAYSGMTGLSDSMSPGNLASLAQSDAIAFRADFEGDTPPPEARYWRGPVLWDFDGRTWTIGPQFLVNFQPPQGGRATYRYGVVLEAHNRHWMFALETAASLPERARMTFDGQVLATTPVRTRVRYPMVSVLDPDPRTEERNVLGRALRVPTGLNPRAVTLAGQWRAAAAGSDLAVVLRAIDFFKGGGYQYTLEPPLLGADTVDEFLFKTKAGFCEHFASAFSFLMRSAGVPARVVTGYQGGELNPYDRIFTVRQIDAHAWVEVWLSNRGWVRVDPTAAAIPSRVVSGLARTVSAGEPLPLLMRPQLEWLQGLRHQWDALAHKWNVWVLGYNPDRQRELMLFFGMRDADWQSLAAALFTVLGLFTLALLVWSLRRLVRPDPVQAAWRAFCRKLAARGVTRAPHEGPRDYAQRASGALPAQGRPILDISELYIALRYGAHGNVHSVQALRRQVRELRLT